MTEDLRDSSSSRTAPARTAPARRARKPSTNMPNHRDLRGFCFRHRLGDRRCHHRMLALDHAARDIAGDGIDDDGHVMRFGEHDAAESRVLHEAVDPLVAAHQHMGDDVDPQPRGFALADAAIEQVDLLRAPRQTADRAPRSGSRAARLRRRAVRRRRRCDRRPRSGPGATRRAAASVAFRGPRCRCSARLTFASRLCPEGCGRG